MASALDYEAIRNVVAKYCFALDTKNFDLLKEVFVPDLQADYPISARSYSSREDLSAAIQKRLTHVTSQHAITTQHIEVAEDGKSGKSSSYFTGVHFGTGEWDGKEVTAWGMYTDSLIRLDGPATLPGTSGRWMIKTRQVRFFKRLGDEGVLQGE